VSITCPCCWDDFPTDQAYIAHRFRTIANWLHDCGEIDAANRYNLKDPSDYHLENRIITPNDPRTITEQATDDHNESVTRALGWKRYARTDGTIWTNPDFEEDR
jgi:hypothetical protein